jgi:outer membrane protein assembly factor BamB
VYAIRILNYTLRKGMTMTTKEAGRLIGRKGFVSNGDGVIYQVDIQDHKKVWNLEAGRIPTLKDRFYVTPVAGKGGAWKELTSISLVTD